MAETLLETQALSVSRGPRRVLADISFSIGPGELLAVVGPNGAGKSTLLKAVAGLLAYDGVIRITGRDARALGGRERARLVAYVPQHSALEAALPVREVVTQGRFAHRSVLERPSAADLQAVARALALTDTARLADRPFSKLSYGERRMVLLARALATGAGLLLLDEPTAALDVRHSLTLLDVLRGLAAGGAAVILVLHQLQEAASACHRALLVADGRCVAAGPVAEVLSAEHIRRVYGVEVVAAAQFGYRLPERSAP